MKINHRKADLETLEHELPRLVWHIFTQSEISELLSHQPTAVPSLSNVKMKAAILVAIFSGLAAAIPTPARKH